jgi:hypothetical protein
VAKRQSGPCDTRGRGARTDRGRSDSS